MPKHPRKYRREKPLPSKKKKREEKSWEIREEDKPHVGDIWRVTVPAIGIIYEEVHWHYLILQETVPFDGFSFLVLCLESGLKFDIYFNFELDDWHLVA